MAPVKNELLWYLLYSRGLESIFYQLGFIWIFVETNVNVFNYAIFFKRSSTFNAVYSWRKKMHKACSLEIVSIGLTIILSTKDG